MLTFLNFFISSFSQLLSSPSFTVMANKSVLIALDHREFGSQDDVQSASAGGTDERHLRHVELESSLKASLLKSSPPRKLALSHSRGTSHSGIVPTPPVPANSPSLTPSNSFPNTCGDTSSAAISGDSTCPKFGPSVSGTPTFDLSLISDSSDCPDEEFEFFPSDSISISSDQDIQMPENLSKGVGLGLTGIRKHDGSGQFDGVGLVSIRRWLPRSARITQEADTYIVQLPESLSQDPRDEGDAEISDIFLQELAMTFIQDPFHIHSLATIPECQSWSELELDESESCNSVSVGIRGEFETSHALPASNKDSISELGRMKKHFSASTISSELKRASVPTSARRMYPGGMRTRSSTWPSHARSRPHQVKPGDGELGVVN